MPTDAGLAMQQALLFPGNTLLLFLPLWASSYVSLPTTLYPFKILATEITTQFLDLRKQLVQLLTDHFIPACPGYCLPTFLFLQSRASDSLFSYFSPVRQHTGSWRSTNTVHKNHTRIPSFLTESLCTKEMPKGSSSFA